MHDLPSEYNKVMYSDLPVRYFHINFKEIKTICESNPIFLKKFIKDFIFQRIVNIAIRHFIFLCVVNVVIRYHFFPTRCKQKSFQFYNGVVNIVIRYQIFSNTFFFPCIEQL